LSENNYYKNQLLFKKQEKLKEPKMYNVIMYNDDFTTMDFVVEILINIFHKSLIEANNLMMKIHNTGKAIVGTYTYDIAITKKMITESLADKNEFPLKVTIKETVD